MLNNTDNESFYHHQLRRKREILSTQKVKFIDV